MKFARFALCFLLAALFAPGCTSPNTERQRAMMNEYYRVRITSPRGELIADYIAEGKPRRTELGYSFRAVERTTHPPEQMTLTYPRTRRIEVAGPNIVISRSGKPLWLYQIDGY